MKDFMDFVKKQGVVGIAVGFILGGAIAKFVEGLSAGIIDPLIASLFDTTNLTQQTAVVGDAILSWGWVVTLAINLVVVSLVVYWGVKALNLDGSKKKKKKSKK